MSWGTDFKVNVFIKHVNVENIAQAQDYIDELDESIEDCKRKIAMYAASNPNDLVRDTDWSDEPIDWLNMRINELWDDIIDFMNQRFKLELFIGHLEDIEFDKQHPDLLSNQEN